MSTRSTSSKKRVLLAIAGAIAINATLAGGLLAASKPKAVKSMKGPSPVVVKVQDDCDPVTFNAALGDGTCIGDGDTTLDSLFGQLVEKQDAPKWRFSREKAGVKAGRAVHVHNEGGEFHTFTEVANFGGGCVPPLNGPLGLSPVTECEPEAAPGVPLAFVTTGVPAGGGLNVGPLSKGVHKFECLIHPWMRSTITVK